MKSMPVPVVIGVAAVLLVTMIIPAIQNMDLDPEEEEETVTMQFDEYRPSGPTVKEVTGVLELTTIDGTAYIHATDIGTGTVSHWDGTEEEVTVGKGKLDLFLMWGQSNAAYYGDPQPSEASPRPSPGNAYFWGLYYSGRDPPTYAYAVQSSSPWSDDYISKCRMYDVWTDGECIIGNLLPAFAASYTQETGHRVYWVSAAVGGASLTLFQPGQTDYVYAQKVIQAAMAQIDPDKWEVTPIGFGWWHGSADNNKTVAQYVDLFTTMFDALKEGGLGVTFDHCFLSLTRSTTNPYKAHMVLGERPDVTIVEDIVRTFPDEADDPSYYANNHYSQKGYNLAGDQMGRNTGKVVAEWERKDEPVDPVKLILNFVPILIAIGLMWFGGSEILRRT